MICRLLLLAFVCPCFGFSQYSYKEEKIIFPENVVSDVVFGTFRQDGFLYIATQKGLYLYDGYIFVKNEHIANSVRHFYTDGTTIYLEEGGVGLVSVEHIYAEKKILEEVVYTDSDQNNDHYENIYKDPFGNVWCSDFNQIKFLNPENQLRSYVINRDNKHLNLDANYIPAKDGLIITSDFGIFRWNNSQDQSLIKIISEKITSSVLYNGKIYVTKDNHAVHEFSLPDKKLKEQLFDMSGNRFVQNITDGTPLVAYGQHSVYELDFTNRSKRLISTSEEHINHIFYDQKAGIFWISTQNGLIKLIRGRDILNDIELPAHGTITSLLETEKGVFWLSDGNGNVIRKSGNNTKAFYIDEKTYQMSFSAKTLLVSTEKGVYGIDPANENSSFRKIISTPQKIKKALIHNGKIWTLPESGQIGIYDANTYDEIPHFIKNIDDYLENVLYNDIIADRGKIWIASWMPKSYGITYFDEQSQLLKQITKGDRTDQVFVGDYYNRVNRLKDGSLIFSAYGGWNIVAENGKILKSISVKDFGIAVTTNIQGIAEDDTGNIWFGCEDGLYRYSPAFGSVIRISKRDGLISNDLRYGFMMSSENQLYFATGKKVQKLDFNALQKLELFDDLKITGIRIDNQYLPDIPDRIEISEVSAQQIDIYFSVLNFWGKDKIKYRYHFGNEDWQELNNEPRLSLVKLGHGNYDITIEAYDDLDGSHRKQLSLQLHIIPPFYKTLWFIVLIGLCLCALVFSITRYLILREKKEGQLMKKIKENENKMLRSQMNPHFVFNSLNSINSFIIQKKQHEASGYLTSFSKLMRKILDNSRKDIITLKDELEATRLYLDLEAVRLDHKFDYSIRIDKNIREDEVRIPALILQPFLENAVWHGINPKSGNGFIEIAISTARDETNPCLYIKIEDNGIGRKATTYKNKETLHKSHGLAITLERLQMNDPRNKVEITDLYHENNEPTGTLVQLKIFYDND